MTTTRDETDETLPPWEFISNQNDNMYDTYAYISSIHRPSWTISPEHTPSTNSCRVRVRVRMHVRVRVRVRVWMCVCVCSVRVRVRVRVRTSCPTGCACSA